MDLGDELYAQPQVVVFGYTSTSRTGKVQKKKKSEISAIYSITYNKHNSPKPLTASTDKVYGLAARKE
jgi:hypothetical protein